MVKKHIIPVIVLLTLLVIGGVVYLGYKKILKINFLDRFNQTIGTAPAVNVIEQPVHTLAEITTTLEGILAKKYNKSVSDVKVTISQRVGDFVVGGVKFGPDFKEGGYLLAADVMGAWRVVFDGNGTIPCTIVDQINFPSSLLKECWDTTKGVVEDRTARTGITLQQ